MKFEIPAMLKNGGGTIVNAASTYGLISSTAGHVPYAAAKHGVIGLTKAQPSIRQIRHSSQCDLPWMDTL